MTALVVVQAGPATRVEHLGQRGRAHLGWSMGGAADPRSLSLANLAVGNDVDAPGLEVTLLGPTLRAVATCTVAWCGPPSEVHVEDVPLKPLQATVLQPGQQLCVGRCRVGVRLAVAVAGGVRAPAAGTLVRDGDALEIGEPRPPRRLPATLAPDIGDHTLLRVTEGPQWDLFMDDAHAALWSEPFLVTPDASRRGVHLRGPALRRAGATDLPSEGIPLGAVQVTDAGDPILLHVDQNTTGGYAKIACVASVDLWRVGQLRPGSRVRFARVSIDEARRELLAWRSTLSTLTFGAGTTSAGLR